MVLVLVLMLLGKELELKLTWRLLGLQCSLPGPSRKSRTHSRLESCCNPAPARTVTPATCSQRYASNLYKHFVAPHDGYAGHAATWWTIPSLLAVPSVYVCALADAPSRDQNGV